MICVVFRPSKPTVLHDPLVDRREIYIRVERQFNSWSALQVGWTEVLTRGVSSLRTTVVPSRFYNIIISFLVRVSQAGWYLLGKTCYQCREVQYNSWMGGCRVALRWFGLDADHFLSNNPFHVLYFARRYTKGCFGD
jgi:hypothetical protein